MISLYLHVLSPLHGAPVLIYYVPKPTTKWAMKQSSVSPDLWLTITFQLSLYESLVDSIAPETVPT